MRLRACTQSGSSAVAVQDHTEKQDAPQHERQNQDKTISLRGLTLWSIASFVSEAGDFGPFVTFHDGSFDFRSADTADACAPS